MQAMSFIRKSVFGLTQAAFAVVAGVTQGTISKWEAGEFEPTRDQLVRIREEARTRGIEWDDAWFFEHPDQAASHAA